MNQKMIREKNKRKKQDIEVEKIKEKNGKGNEEREMTNSKTHWSFSRVIPRGRSCVDIVEVLLVREICSL
jgi:hypothetical protein